MQGSNRVTTEKDLEKKSSAKKQDTKSPVNKTKKRTTAKSDAKASTAKKTAAATTKKTSPAATKKTAAATTKKSLSSDVKSDKTKTKKTKPITSKTGQSSKKDEPKSIKSSARPLPRLLSRFRMDVAPELKKEFGYTSLMQVPRLNKITLNIGLAEALQNPKSIESATRDLSLISGQHPVTTKARKSIAAFKLREGQTVGVTVTLRGRKMYEFLDRTFSSALPRIRDFRGLPTKAFDGRGNYTIGIREQIIFPEIDYNTIDRLRGLQIVIVTTATTNREGQRLLELLGAPFSTDLTTAQ